MKRKFIISDNHEFHRHGRMVVEFTTTCPIVAYHHSRIYLVERIYISRDLTYIVCKYVTWREQVRFTTVQFVDDANALTNGGNFHRFNILNQYL